MDEIEKLIITTSESSFRRWVVENILAIQASIEESKLTQEKIDELTAKVIENREKIVSAKKE